MDNTENKFDGKVFAERFKRARTLSGMTQSEMADELHTHQGIISLYETGERDPSPELIGEYARLCHVTPDYFYETMYDLPSKEDKIVCQMEIGNDTRALKRFMVISECLEAVLAIIKRKITELSKEIDDIHKNTR